MWNLKVGTVTYGRNRWILGYLIGAAVVVAQVPPPSSPAKEYVYAGGKLVAIEIPGSISVNNVSPSSLTLVPGGNSQNITVTVTRTNFTGNVTLGVGTLPSGVTAVVTSPGSG